MSESKRRPISAEEEELLFEFGRSLSNLRSPASIAAYQSDIRLFAEHTPDVNLLRITDEQEDEYVAELHRHGFKSRTLSRKATSLRYFREFVVAGAVARNGVGSVTPNVISECKRDSTHVFTGRSVIDKGLAGFLQHLGNCRSQATVRAYSSDLVKFRTCLRNTVDWQHVTKQLVSDFLNEQIASGLNANSSARLLSTIRSLFQWLRHNGYTAGNPALLLHLPRSVRRDSIPSQIKLQAVLTGRLPSDFPALRNLLILELLYTSGLRVAEISSLDISSIDLNKKRLTIEGRGNRRRYIAVGDSVAKVLSRYLQVRATVVTDASGPLVVNLRGGRLTPRSIGRVVEHLTAKHKLPEGTHPYSLRHAHVNHSVKAGKHIQDIRHNIGVAGISSGLKIGN